MNDNCVNVTASPGETRGDPARLELTPNTAYVTITNEVRTSREDSAFGIDVHREPGTNAIRLTGTIALHATPARVDASIDNPALYVATLLREALARRGIAVRGPALATSEIREKQKYASMTLLDAISSPPLSEIVDVLNHQSVNLYAELILKTMAKERTGEGSFARGASLVRQYLIDIGIAADRLSIVDGSGLSRLDLVSPHAFATLLRAVQRNRGWKAFLNSLPVAGKSGTLESRLKGTCAEGTVRAKTGTLTFARSLAGYATTKDDETLVFALLCNNFTVPVSLADNIQDLVLMRLANFSRR
jgi:PBP4 family serine-type D-alanyl-D-alanine carboxypeptidase